MTTLLRLIIENGGLTVVLIALLSLMAVTVVVERCWRLLPLRRRFATVRAVCNEAMLRSGPNEALAALQADDPMTRVLRSGLLNHPRGAEVVRVAAHNAAQREVAGIERGLSLVQIAAQIAPWLGLLGTVIGLMEVFHDTAFHLLANESAAAANAPPSNANVAVASGIYKALASTVAGLVVAIGTYVAYGMLSTLSNRLIDELENAAADLPLSMREKT